MIKKIIIRIIKPNLIVWTLLMLVGCQSKEEVMPKEELLDLLSDPKDQLHIINFWSITCKPCITEMPQFVEVAEKYPKISMTLIGLDGIEAMDKHFRFIKKHHIEQYSRLLDAPVYHEWMEKVDQDYWGTMPATLIYNHNRNQRIFINRELNEGELEQINSQHN